MVADDTAGAAREVAELADPTVASLASPTVKFGEPLDFSRYDGMESDRLILRAVTDEIMYKIMELSGQEYIDMYATKAKQLEGRATTGAPKKVRKSDT